VNRSDKNQQLAPDIASLVSKTTYFALCNTQLIGLTYINLSNTRRDINVVFTVVLQFVAQSLACYSCPYARVAVSILVIVSRVGFISFYIDGFFARIFSITNR